MNSKSERIVAGMSPAVVTHVVKIGGIVQAGITTLFATTPNKVSGYAIARLISGTKINGITK